MHRTLILALGLLSGWELDPINALANQVASYVCARPGATPPMPDEFRSRLSPQSGGRNR